MFSIPRLSPYLTLFFLLPILFLIVPDPLRRLYQIATFKMPDQDDHQHHLGQDHHHSHDHHHNHDDPTSFTEKNRAHWDSQATSYSSLPWQKAMLNSIHAFLLHNLTWLDVPFVSPSDSFENAQKPSNPIRVLDYACGPGTITDILYSHAHEFVGVDLAQGMVDEYNRRFAHTLPGEVATTNAKAVVGNLIDPAGESSVPEAELGSFDLVAVGLGFHHFQRVDVALERLSAYLKKGGVLLIVDLVTHAKESTEEVNPAKHTVAHHGFAEEDVKRLFDGAGLSGFGYMEMEEEVFLRGTERRKVFMAKGAKA
jgi:SAM-dependent methyltransferase